MVLLAGAAQCMVWGAVTLGRPHFMFWEEVCWAGIFVCNTAASSLIYLRDDGGGGARSCEACSLAFGCVYLPWQLGLHLPSLTGLRQPTPPEGGVDWASDLWQGLRQAMTLRRPSRLAADWGGAVGAVWMVGYWVLLPYWLLFVARTYQ